MENKKMFFEIDANQVDFKSLLSKEFLTLDIRAISSANPNRNNSWFTRESMERSLHSFYNKPILGYFENNDFVSHNGEWTHDDETGMDYWDTTGKRGERILGVIRDSDPVQIVQDKDGLYWVQLSCVLWVEYNFKQVKKLIKDAKRAKANGGPAKNVSVEVDITDYEILDNGVMKIKEFNLVGITILGSRNGVKVEPGIENAGLSVIDVMGRDVFEKQEQGLRLAYERLDNKSAEKKEELSTMGENQEMAVEFEEKKETAEEEHLEETLPETGDENGDKKEGCKECEEQTETCADEEKIVCEEDCPCEPEEESEPSDDKEDDKDEDKGEALCCNEVEGKEEPVCESCGEVHEEEEDVKEDECKYAELEAQFNELKEKYEALNREYESAKAQLESRNDYDAIKSKLNAYEHKEFLGKAAKLIESGNLDEATSNKLFEACDAGKIADLDDLKVKVALEAFECKTLDRGEQPVREGVSLNIPVSTPEISSVFSDTKKNIKKNCWDVLNEMAGK